MDAVDKYIAPRGRKNSMKSASRFTCSKSNRRLTRKCERIAIKTPPPVPNLSLRKGPSVNKFAVRHTLL